LLPLLLDACLGRTAGPRAPVLAAAPWPPPPPPPPRCTFRPRPRLFLPLVRVARGPRPTAAGVAASSRSLGLRSRGRRAAQDAGRSLSFLAVRRRVEPRAGSRLRCTAAATTAVMKATSRRIAPTLRGVSCAAARTTSPRSASSSGPRRMPHLRSAALLPCGSPRAERLAAALRQAPPRRAPWATRSGLGATWCRARARARLPLSLRHSCAVEAARTGQPMSRPQLPARLTSATWPLPRRW
jgi:hypothetical protein